MIEADEPIIDATAASPSLATSLTPTALELVSGRLTVPGNRLRTKRRNASRANNPHQMIEQQGEKSLLQRPRTK